jgi:Fic family protein
MAENKVTSERAGWQEPQVDGSVVFIPKDLPPSPSIDMSGSLWQLTCEAERRLGWLGGYAQTLPSADSFGHIVLAKEAVYSSQLEGSEITVADLLTWQIRAESEGSAVAAAELRLATNCMEAITWGIAELDRRELGTDLLIALHQKLFGTVRGRDGDAGRLRQSEIWIGPPGSTIQTARYVPPLARLVPELVERAMIFANSDTSTPTLVRIALFYYQLETTFPFVDGSGRVARLMISLLLSRERDVRPDLISLSAFFARDRAERFHWLERVRERGDWEGWVSYFLRGIREAVDESVAMINSALKMRRQHVALCEATFRRSSSTVTALLDWLLGHPVVSVDGVAQTIGRSFANANQLVSRFEKMGLLVEVTGRRRNRHYCYEPYLRLFETERTGANGP